MKLDFTEIPENLNNEDMLYNILECLVGLSHKESESSSTNFSEEDIADILSEVMNEECIESENLHVYDKCNTSPKCVSVHSLIVRLDEEVNKLYNKLKQSPIEVRTILDMNFTRAAYDYDNQLTSVLIDDFMFDSGKITALYIILGDKYLPDILNNLSSDKTLYNIITDIILGLSTSSIDDINNITISILNEF